MTAGAVAAGSRHTVEAGLRALRLGGNAADAAVAAQLMACVSEPALTGLGGGGLAMVRMHGNVELLDFFSCMPGLGAPARERAEMTTVEVDFGPTKQAFHVGPASVAVPGTPAGVWALHERYGRLPVPLLAEPAIAAAREGLSADSCAEVVSRLLWPIEELIASNDRLAGPEGLPLRQGDTFRNPALGDTIASFAERGPSFFSAGAAAEALLRALGPDSALTAADLERYAAVFREPLTMEFRGATVWVPRLPSQGGPMILRSLMDLAEGPLSDPLGADSVDQMGRALERAVTTRPDKTLDELFSEAFIPSYLGAGFTTHISTVDEDGNAVALTSSLGETSGVCVPETGIRPNNFLGEADVNPVDQQRQPGARLMTMCSPALVSHAGRVFAMGSGGSSRIRSAVLHGIVYLVGHGMRPDQLVDAPRCHKEEGQLRVEVFGRTKETVDLIRKREPSAVFFEERGMYFGGLHIAGIGPDGAEGGGDPRRSGAFGVVQ